jgi:hypothetical protein
MTDDTVPAPAPAPALVFDKVAVFRSFAEAATKNSHATIKQVWTILFTGGTFALLHSFYQWVISVEDIFDGSLDPIGPQSWCDRFHFDPSAMACWGERHGMELSTLAMSFLLFVVYLLTFYRFYVGNIRVFDMKYDEIFKFINTLHKADNWDGGPDNLKKNLDYKRLLDYSTRLSGTETFQLMINTLVIVFLTVLPLNPLMFLFAYLILLVLDMRWIRKGEEGGQHFFSDRFFEEFGGSPPKELIEEVFPKYATDRWHKNNGFCFLYLLFILIFYLMISCGDYKGGEQVQQLLLWCGAGVAFLNCYVDLHDTWDFYNPKFSQAHESVVDNYK